MKVLVTGAGGFVGRVLTRMLAERGHDVTGLDLGEPVEGAEDWIRITADTPLNTTLLPTGIDAVIHLAQSPAYRQGAAGEESVFMTNVAMYAALLRWAANTGVKQFSSASTGTIYEPFDGPMHEDTPVSPTGYYGASKYAAEVLANAYQDRMTLAHLRLFFVYGPHQKDMLMARLIESIRSGKTVGLPAKGTGLKFVPTYVDDVARCFVESIENSWSGPVNVASPEVVTFKKVLDTISKSVGKDLNLERKGDSPKHPIVPDLSKLQTLTDMSQFHNLKTGIQNTVEA